MRSIQTNLDVRNLLGLIDTSRVVVYNDTEMSAEDYAELVLANNQENSPPF